MWKILWIVAILGISNVIRQGDCKPDKLSSKDINYVDDTPQEYDDEEPEIDNDNNKTISSGPPEILSQAMVVDAAPGDNVELPCQVINTEDHVVVWKKDEDTLYFGGVSVGEKMEKKITKTSNNSLIIFNVTKNDSFHNYKCAILNGDNAIEIVHRVRIVNKPKELENNSHQLHVVPNKRVEVNESESITFGCETNFPSKTEIKWSHKGERLHNDEIIKDNGNYITIKNASRNHSGRYQCLAEDGSEKPAHEAIEVVVKYKPQIDIEHEVVHTGMGQTTTLTCKVFAYPRAKVTWWKNQKLITNKKDKKIIQEDRALRTLIIEHTNKHDLGTYSCVATNQMGETSKDIIVTATPARPKFIGGEIADDETTIILKWHVESFSPIIEYNLEYRREGDLQWKSVMPNVENSNGKQFIVKHALENLLPGTSYEAKLAAKNDFGWSSHSASHKFDKEYVADEPQNVKGQEKGISNATINRALPVLTSTLLVLLSYISICL